MAILQMEHIHLCAMKRDRKKILELLQRRGTVEIQDVSQQDDVFIKMDTSVTQGLFAKNAETAEQAVEILGRYCEEKKPSLGFLRGRAAVSVQQSDAFYKRQEEVLRKAQRIVQLDREIGEARAEILRAEGLQAALEPWMQLPVPQTFKGTKRTAAFVGGLEGEYTAQQLLALLAEAEPELDKVQVDVVYTSKEQTNFLVMVLKADEGKAEAALRNIGFSRPASPSRRMPQEQMERLEGRKREAADKEKAAAKEIAEYETLREDFRFLADHMKMRAEKYGVIDKLAHTRHVFVLEGYVPAVVAQKLQKELADHFECAVELSAVGEEEDAPMLLHNNRFMEPIETVLESYSLPGKGEVDPSPVMSVFYYLMFGLMFSDAGYGFLMAGVCAVCLLAFKNMEYSWKKNLRMFFWCGVSTVFWGVMFSSYFGDVVQVVSSNFFGREVTIPPLWISPLEQPMLLLMFCLGLGIIHMSFGMVLKTVTLVKAKQYADVVYDVVFALMCVYPLIVVLMGSDMFAGMAGFRLPLPAMATNICLGIAGVGMVGTLFTGGRESRNWFKRLLKGAYALYNVLAGWLGDILSYSRLLALGLATGVIASVVNSMGAMIGTGAVAFIIFIVIFVVGHLLNFGINVLGAYVHSNRLEFVEFFGKFYEGGGRKFAPFGIHTKHYKIEEETQNA